MSCTSILYVDDTHQVSFQPLYFLHCMRTKQRPRTDQIQQSTAKQQSDSYIQMYPHPPQTLSVVCQYNYCAFGLYWETILDGVSCTRNN